MQPANHHQPMGEIFPSVPPEWADAFRRSQQKVARRLVVAVACLVIILMPVLQLLEYWLRIVTGNMLWLHGFLRLPLVLGALLIIYFRLRWPERHWPRSASLLFSLALISVGWTMLVVHYTTGSAEIAYASHGLTISTAAVPILAIYGLRDLLIIYVPPLLSAAASVLWLGADTGADASYLVYPLVAVCIGAVIAEMLFRGHIQVFVATRRLEHSAMTDPLTQLLNRRAMDRLLSAEHAAYLRHSTPYAVLMADLDHFKQVNDCYGHDVGDQVLKELSQRLRDTVRAEDQVARWGGEEFVILLRNADAGIAHQVAEKIRHQIESNSFSSSAGRLSLTMSVGGAVSAPDVSYEKVLVRADEALYQAKNSGRNLAIMHGEVAPQRVVGLNAPATR